jgi:hypothetical protein
MMAIRGIGGPAGPRKAHAFLHRRCSFETLERRELFSAGVSPSPVADAAALLPEYVEASTAAAVTTVAEGGRDFADKEAHALGFKLGTNGTLITGALGDKGDQDWLMFKATGKKVVATVRSDPGGVVCNLYDSDGGCIHTRDASTSTHCGRTSSNNCC